MRRLTHANRSSVNIHLLLDHCVKPVHACVTHIATQMESNNSANYYNASLSRMQQPMKVSYAISDPCHVGWSVYDMLIEEATRCWCHFQQLSQAGSVLYYCMSVIPWYVYLFPILSFQSFIEPTCHCTHPCWRGAPSALAIDHAALTDLWCAANHHHCCRCHGWGILRRTCSEDDPEGA